MAPTQMPAVEFRVRGRVQGVGFRPTVWRIARELGLAGEVFNDGEGVLLRAGGDEASLAALIARLETGLPPLARIDAIERRDYYGRKLPPEFRIAESAEGGTHTQISPDAAICEACAAELRNPNSRRYRYAFNNCTHCGPRLSIVTGVPYDRATTTMAMFPLCGDCRGEYHDPKDRRFRAEAMACPVCGPAATLVSLSNDAPPPTIGPGAVEIAAGLLQSGEIIAIKGLGGYHLACDAFDAEVVARLRRLKRREAKPFALMTRSVEVVRRYCSVDGEEHRQLASVEGPIVLLRADGPRRLPDAVAPGLRTLGFMLPTTPLHLLICEAMDKPLVMTSGNLSDEPPIIDDDEARRKLAGVAGYALTHNRRIANRLDDSIVRVIGGKARTLRRARGFAPSPIKLPPGLESAPDVLALGGELKATFCLVKDAQAILSQHQGDLESASTFDDYHRALGLYRDLFDHAPKALIIDGHPEYVSSKFGHEKAREQKLPLIEVQHHHAHAAACLAENKYPFKSRRVLGIVMDGLGFGDDGSIWGGEFLLADYLGYKRLARLKPVAMPGGERAVREPWRNLYAHLDAAIGWPEVRERYPDLELGAFLNARPLAMLDAMIERGINSPLASSCGRLFDAVAAALGVCRDCQTYEGEAAARLEALASPAMQDEDVGYAFCIDHLSPLGLLEIDPSTVWKAILTDIARGVDVADVALRFHVGFANAVADTAIRLAGRKPERPLFDTVALSGGCFQNSILFGAVARRLSDAGFTVLSHAEVPANDGGLSLGQAAIGAARLVDAAARANERVMTCA